MPGRSSRVYRTTAARSAGSLAAGTVALHLQKVRILSSSSLCCRTLLPVKYGAALQGIREYQSDTFDDWRDLLEEQERRTRDELDASKARYPYAVLSLQSTHRVVAN